MYGRSQMIALLNPDIRDYITRGFKLGFKRAAAQLYNVKSSKQRSERSVILNPMGLAEEIPTGRAVQFDSPSQGTTKNYVHLTFGRGVKVPFQLIDDNLHPEILNMTQMLGAVGSKTMELQQTDPFNNAFANTYYSSGDGVAYASNSHTVGSDTIDTLATQGALTYATFLAALYQLQRQNDGRGTLGGYGFGRVNLIIPIELQDKANAVVKTLKIPGSANNDVSYIANELDVRILLLPLASSTTAWAIQDATNHDMTYYNRMSPTTSRDGDWDSGALKWKIVWRMSLGQNDPRGIVWNQGA